MRWRPYRRAAGVVIGLTLKCAGASELRPVVRPLQSRSNQACWAAPRTSGASAQTPPLAHTELVAYSCAYLGCTRRSDVTLRERALWRLLYETAARANEILALDIDNLDLVNKRARIRSTGGATEWVFWQTGAALLLPRLLAGRPSGPVFLADRQPTRAVPNMDQCPITVAPDCPTAVRPSSSVQPPVDTPSASTLGTHACGRGPYQCADAACPLSARFGPIHGTLRAARPRGSRPPRRRARPSASTTLTGVHQSALTA